MHSPAKATLSSSVCPKSVIGVMPLFKSAHLYPDMCNLCTPHITPRRCPVRLEILLSAPHMHVFLALVSMNFSCPLTGNRPCLGEIIGEIVMERHASHSADRQCEHRTLAPLKG
eukprot:5169280-Amphidinium_carterae.1